MRDNIQKVMQTKLTLIREIDEQVKQGKGRLRRRRVGIFRCKCGNEKPYVIEQVVGGHIKQCWDCAVIARTNSRKTHEKSKHPLYRKWQDMKNRCYNKSVDHYKNYGGRGISVCKEWKNNFVVFYDWCIESGWKSGLQVDRIDNNKNYTPANCQISTHIEQGYNKTNTRYVVYGGKKICFSKLIKELNLTHKYHSIYTEHIRRKIPLIDIIEKYK